MVRIRMRRVGAKNQPSYRIVAADRESPRDGRFLEAIGFYNPRTEPSTIQIDEARLFHWMEHGAQPSDSVVQALRSAGTWDRWERFKAGEAIDTLLKESEAAMPEVDPRTRRDDLFDSRQKKKSSKETEKGKVKEEAAAAVAEVKEADDTGAVEAAEDEPAAEEAGMVLEASAKPAEDAGAEVDQGDSPPEESTAEGASAEKAVEADQTEEETEAGS